MTYLTVLASQGNNQSLNQILGHQVQFSFHIDLSASLIMQLIYCLVFGDNRHIYRMFCKMSPLPLY